MKRNLFAIFLAVMLVAALLFVVAPSAQATDSNLIYLDENNSVTITADDQDKILDLKGNKNATVNFEVSTELKVIDTSFELADGNLDLTGDLAGILTIDNAEGVNGSVAPISQYGDYRYLAVEKDGKFSFHPFNMAISKRGINVLRKTVSLEAMFIANNVVRDMITDFGVYKHDGNTTGRMSANKSFDAKNGVVACWDLSGSLSADMLPQTRTFSAYIKIGDTVIEATQKVDVTPEKVLGGVNDAYAAGKYTGETKVLADKLYADNADLQEYLPAMGPDVKLNIAAFTNGTVTADKASYKIGDKITLTIAPAGGYFQKLYINGEPLMLDWKTFTYSFTATEEAYEITGSFEQGLNLAPSDWGRWDDHNQLHGMLNTYYPNNNDSWWMDIKGNYESLTVRAKNYLPIAETLDNFMVYLRVTMDNGYTYNFRIFTDKGGYTAYNRAGIQNTGDASADWGGWKNLSKLDAKITTEGVNFKVERTDANVLTLSVDGEVLDTYTMNGITADNKITAIGIKHQGNKGKYVEVPYVVTVPTEKPTVTVNVPAFENGTVTADKASYKVGEAVRLTIAPASGYSQKLYINGEPLMLDWKTNTYAFIATEEVYNITGSFVPSLNTAPRDANRWDASNQAHGILNAYYPNKDDAWTVYIADDSESISVKAKNYMLGDDGTGVNEFAVVIGFKMSNGSEYCFRVVKQGGVYYHQRFGIGGSDWSKKKLDDVAIKAILGDGVDFKLERTGANKLTIYVNGVVYDTYTMSGITEDITVTNIVIGHYGNKGAKVALPFTIADPIFKISGGNWNLNDQYNGSLTILNKTKDGTGVISIGKNYTEASVTVKEYTPSKNADGTLKKGDFSAQLSFVFDNGKQYEVRIHNTNDDGNYKIQTMGNPNNLPDTKWKWLKDLTAAQKEDLLNGDGVKFTAKLEGTAAVMYVNDAKMATVNLGEEYAGKTAQIKIVINGNNYGGNIEIPFELK